MLLYAIVLAGCATDVPVYRSTLPHYRTGDCYRYPTGNQGERIGQIQIIKDTQYYLSVLANGSDTYEYHDWIPIERLERISTPTPCPSGTPYPISPDVQPTEQRKPNK